MTHADRGRELERAAALAGADSPEAVYAAAAEELAHVLDPGTGDERIERAVIARYEADHTFTVLEYWGEPSGAVPRGERWPIEGPSVIVQAFETGRPARIDDSSDLAGAIADSARPTGMRSAVAVPIIVGGIAWGTASVHGRRPLPDGIEHQIAEFARLIGLAVANADAQLAAQRLAEEQAALRRVATLVARQPSAEEVFDVVVREVGRLLKADETRLLRLEPDGSATMVSGWPPGGDIPARTNRQLDGDSLTERIRRTRAPARVDDDSGATGQIASDNRAIGTRAAAGAPIIVDGRVWGALLATSRVPGSLPSGVEARIEEFSALVATAISDLEARAALTASRERIVVAADETRRRFERDLHDGAQQRLVSLALGLRLLQAEAPRELRARISAAVDGITAVLDDLRELSSRLHPAILSEGGLRPALRALARRSVVPVRLREEPDERFEERVEIAAYCVVSEALANAAKHADATVVDLSVGRRHNWLRVAIRDDGAGGADATKGSGLVGLTDRVEALGGTIAVLSARGEGTAIEVELPLAPSSS